MKKILFFSLICLMALSVNAQWVDLGLPSGTLWKDKNEKREFYTYKQAVNKFGKRLPTKEQLEELVTKCQWTWMGCGYKVVGPNGQSIYLPAAGYRSCDGGVNYVNSYGDYWSSTLFSGFAWRLYFFSGSAVHMNNSDQCYGRSVRLVKNKACARKSASKRHQNFVWLFGLRPTAKLQIAANRLEILNNNRQGCISSRVLCATCPAWYATV